MVGRAVAQPLGPWQNRQDSWPACCCGAALSPANRSHLNSRSGSRTSWPTYVVPRRKQYEARQLLASMHDTLLELLGDAKYLGAKAGIISTRDTWTQRL